MPGCSSRGRRRAVTKGARTLPASIGNTLIALYSQGDWARLVAEADRVTGSFPRAPIGWKAAGKALLQLGRAPEAVDRFHRLLRLTPGDADGHVDMGNALDRLGQPHEAVKCYRHATKLKPRSSEAHSNLGRVLRAIGRFEDAEASCRTAVALDPASPHAHNNLGNALREQGRPAEAEASYRAALALAPNLLEAQVNLGTALIDLGRWEEAKAAYLRAIETHPDAGSAHEALGRLLSRLGSDDAAATRCLERAIALDSADANTFIELGNILMRARRVDEALAWFRQAQRPRPLITWRANQEKAEFSALFLELADDRVDAHAIPRRPSRVRSAFPRRAAGHAGRYRHAARPGRCRVQHDQQCG